MDHRLYSKLFLMGMAVLFLIVNFMTAADQKREHCCQIVELRQYTLVPGQRDRLIRLFDTHFIESQEETGMFIVGQFRDRNHPDHFVWIRGFSDMDSRKRALTMFYRESPVWKEHAKTANETMLDVNNVLLLKPSQTASGFHLSRSQRPSLGDTSAYSGLVIATIYYLNDPLHLEFVHAFERDFIPILKELNVSLLGRFMTETSKNNFPGLPVRENERVFIWFTSFADEGGYDTFRQEISGKRTLEFFAKNGVNSTEILELLPTSRSLLRHSSSNFRR